MSSTCSTNLPGMDTLHTFYFIRKISLLQFMFIIISPIVTEYGEQFSFSSLCLTSRGLGDWSISPTRKG